MGSAHLLVVPASFFFGHLFVALGLVVNLGVSQAAGTSQPGGWVHEKKTKVVAIKYSSTIFGSTV